MKWVKVLRGKQRKQEKSKEDITSIDKIPIIKKKNLAKISLKA